jgi:hypothetical protein
MRKLLSEELYKEKARQFRQYRQDKGEEKFQAELDEIWGSEYFCSKYREPYGMRRNSDTATMFLEITLKERILDFGQTELNHFLEKHCEDEELRQRLFEVLKNEHCMEKNKEMA